MQYLFLTQYTGKICGPIAKYILGPIMNAIFVFLNWLSIPKIGLAIILFTIVIYLLLLPLTIKQQKFSKLQAKMQPELQAIQNKYKNKKDQDSQMAMSQETTAVYAKYGVSPTGSCLPLLIQMPILFTLYRVIYSIPAYVSMVKDAYGDIVSKLLTKTGVQELLQSFSQSAGFANQFKNDAFVNGNIDYISNTYIDVLNRATASEWASIYEKYPDLKDTVINTVNTLDSYNNFLGINMGSSPSEIIKTSMAVGKYGLVVLAVLIPVLSAVTQWINTKLVPQNNQKPTGDERTDSMQQSMKTMNIFMPLFSAFLCLTLPSGMGLYWIAGSVVRSIQQIAINKYIDKMDLEAEIAKNTAKRDAKLKKRGIDPEKLMQNASMSTKSNNRLSNAAKSVSQNQNADQVRESTEYYNKNAKPGSLAAKANMVKQYNERNNKE